MNSQPQTIRFIDYIRVSIPWVLVFILVPGYMISFSPGEYAFMDGKLLLGVSISLTIIFVLASIVLLFIASKLKFSHFVLGCFHFFLMWVALAGFLVPLVMKSGMVDAIDTKINRLNVAIVIPSSTILAWMMYTKMKNIVMIFLAIFITSIVVTNLSPIYGSFKSKRNDGLSALSKEKNIIVLSFDGIPGNYASRAIKEYPVLGKAFKDFKIFNNAVSASPSTALSVTTELHGPIDLSKFGTTQRELYNRLDNSNLLLNSPSFNSYTYGVYGQFNTNKDTAIPIGGLTDRPSKNAQLNEILSFYDFVIVRMGTRYALSFLSLFEHKSFNISNLLYKILRIKPSNEGDLEEKLKHHTGAAEWDVKNILTYNDYVSMVSNLRSSALLPCVRHMHFTFTHYPVDFDIDGAYRSNDKDWHIKNQNHQGAYGETIAALFMLSDFLSKLKELNIYEQSFLVIKSDHGKPPGYYDDAPYNLKINGNPFWGIGRYTPMLMIKPENNTQGGVELLEQFVSLTDLAYTLTKRYMPNTESESIPGINLLNLNEPLRSGDADNIYLYIPENRFTSFAYEDLNAIQIERKRNLYESLISNGSVSLEAQEPDLPNSDIEAKLEISEKSPFSKGSILNFGGPSNSYLSYGMSNIEPWGRWSNSDTCGMKFYFSKDKGTPSNLVLTANGYVTPNHPIQSAEIFLNNSKIGNVEIEHGNMLPLEFTFNLTDESLKSAEVNTLEIKILNPVSPQSLGLHNTDSRLLGIGFIELRFN